MAKKSVAARDVKRAQLIQRYAKKREQLLVEMQQATNAGDFEKYQSLQKKFARIPRDASPVRLRRRCQLTGRPRGVYRKFGLGRNKLRENAMKGNIPGLVKASW